MKETVYGSDSRVRNRERADGIHKGTTEPQGSATKGSGRQRGSRDKEKI